MAIARRPDDTRRRGPRHDADPRPGAQRAADPTSPTRRHLRDRGADDRAQPPSSGELPILVLVLLFVAIVLLVLASTGNL